MAVPLLQCVGPLCYDFSDVEAYMNRPETLKELGVPEGRTCAHVAPTLLPGPGHSCVLHRPHMLLARDMVYAQ